MIWGGENLLNENNIRFFAARVAESLKEYFQDKQIRGIPLLGANETLAFVDGVKQGILDLKRFLCIRPGLPDGVTARMNRLN